MLAIALAHCYKTPTFFCGWFTLKASPVRDSVSMNNDTTASRNYNEHNYFDDTKACLLRRYVHRRRSGWTSGGTHGDAEGGSVSSGVAYGEGYPLSSRLRGLGSVVSSPSGVRGGAPAENGFWRILKATERSFLYLYDKIWGGDNLYERPPLQILGGDLSPLSPPWATPMVT